MRVLVKVLVGNAHVIGIFDVEIDAIEIVLMDVLIERLDERFGEAGVVELQDLLISAAATDGEDDFDAFAMRCIDERADVLVGLVERELHVAALGTGSVTKRRQAEGEVEVRHLGEVDCLGKVGIAAVVVRKVADELGVAIFLPG